MADYSSPGDVKLPMGDDFDDDAPPPFQHHPDPETAVPLLAAEKGAHPQQDQQPRGRCFFKSHFRRGRCTSEQRAQCKSKAKRFFRRFFRRLFIALLAVWAYLSFFAGNEDDDWSLVYPEEDSMPSHGVPCAWFRPTAPEDQAALIFSQVEDIAGSECARDLVPWDGRSIIETDLQRLRINFGKGNLISNVIVRTGDVDVPTLLIRANVTKVHHRDDEDDEDDEGDEEDGQDFKTMIEHHGLHLDFTDSEDALDVSFWADRYVRDDDGEDSPPDDPHPGPPHRKHPHCKHPHRKHPHHKHPHHKHPHCKHPHRKHPHHHRKHHGHDGGDNEEMMMMKRAEMETYEPDHGRRYKRFCATIEVEVLLPASEDSQYSLTVNGIILSTKVEDVEGVSFDELVLRSVVGEIKTGDIRANALIAEVAHGIATVESLQVSTEGSPLFAKVRSTVGNLKLNARTGYVIPPNDDDDDDEGDDGDDEGDNGDDDINELGEINRPSAHHLVIVSTTSGSIDLDVSLASDDDDDEDVRAKGETVPGMLVVRARSSTGHVHSSVDLAEDQQLDFKSTSSSGKISAKISDKFLGHLTVASLLGAAEVTEAEESESVIEYEKNTIHTKAGRKVIDDEDNETGHVEGKVVLGTALGEARLEFF